MKPHHYCPYCFPPVTSSSSSTPFSFSTPPPFPVLTEEKQKYYLDETGIFTLIFPKGLLNYENLTLHV